MTYGQWASTGVDMNLGLHKDSLICIVHAAGEDNRSRIIQWYKQGDEVISTWMIARQERGMEFKCMYATYTGIRMAISICSIWTSGNQDANLVGWNGNPVTITFWPTVAIVPV